MLGDGHVGPSSARCSSFSLVSTCSDRPTPSASDRSNGVIAYADLFKGIDFIDPDGSPAALATGELSDAHRYSSLAWSPHGRTLAFARESLLGRRSTIGEYDVATGTSI
jgi:hypothetical protein